MVNKTSRTFNEFSRNYSSHPTKSGEMEHGSLRPFLLCSSFAGLGYPRIWRIKLEVPEKRGIHNGWDNSKKEKNVERARSPKLRSKLILLNNLVSINSDIAEQLLSVILQFSFWQLSAPASQWRRVSAQPVSLKRCSGLCCWLSGVCGGFSVLSYEISVL